MAKTKIIIWISILGILAANPSLASYIYVDSESNNSVEDGSEANPYHTINQALGQGDQIMVLPGEYPEEITLPENTSLIGEEKNSVIIDRENLEGTVVTMGKNSSIENLTVRGGNYSVVVPPFNKSTVRNCVIEKSKRIGIWIKKNNSLRDNSVEIWDSTVSNNIKKGLFGEARFIYFMNSAFNNNGEEGVDLRSKVKGTLSGCTMSANGEGGIELEIRKAAIEISGSTLYQNRSNGITLNNRTHVGGKIIIKNNNIQENFHYGIRCAGSKNWTKKLWRKVVENRNNVQKSNKKSYISSSCQNK